jgi:hypothetical protein
MHTYFEQTKPQQATQQGERNDRLMPIHDI